MSNLPIETIFPPKCHECGETLEVVYENEYWTYYLDEKTGKYTRNLVDLEIRYPNCNAKLRDEFPDGICKYSDCNEP
jgi:hypothetical protein